VDGMAALGSMLQVVKTLLAVAPSIATAAMAALLTMASLAALVPLMIMPAIAEKASASFAS
jgi:hypothetical protein